MAKGIKSSKNKINGYASKTAVEEWAENFKPVPGEPLPFYIKPQALNNPEKFTWTTKERELARQRAIEQDEMKRDNAVWLPQVRAGEFKTVGKQKRNQDPKLDNAYNAAQEQYQQNRELLDDYEVAYKSAYESNPKSTWYNSYVTHENAHNIQHEQLAGMNETINNHYRRGDVEGIYRCIDNLQAQSSNVQFLMQHPWHDTMVQDPLFSRIFERNRHEPGNKNELRNFMKPAIDSFNTGSKTATKKTKEVKELKSTCDAWIDWINDYLYRPLEPHNGGKSGLVTTAKHGSRNHWRTVDGVVKESTKEFSARHKQLKEEVEKCYKENNELGLSEALRKLQQLSFDCQQLSGYMWSLGRGNSFSQEYTNSHDFDTYNINGETIDSSFIGDGLRETSPLPTMSAQEKRMH